MQPGAVFETKEIINVVCTEQQQDKQSDIKFYNSESCIKTRNERRDFCRKEICDINTLRINV